jgi:hypothetical protein
VSRAERTVHDNLFVQLAKGSYEACCLRVAGSLAPAGALPIQILKKLDQVPHDQQKRDVLLLYWPARGFPLGRNASRGHWAAAVKTGKDWTLVQSLAPNPPEAKGVNYQVFHPADLARLLGGRPTSAYIVNVNSIGHYAKSAASAITMDTWQFHPWGLNILMGTGGILRALKDAGGGHYKRTGDLGDFGGRRSLAHCLAKEAKDESSRVTRRDDLLSAFQWPEGLP